MASTCTSRPAVVFCGTILGLTAAGKLYALLHGSGLLQQPHTFLPGSFKTYVWLGLVAELAAFTCWFLSGARAFLSVCFGLAVLFIAYHAVQVGLHLDGPCPCLGGFLGHWKPLAQSETLLSFLLACGLGTASFVGLFPASRASPPVASSQNVTLPAALSIGVWLLFGGVVAWLWHGRVLGSDEGMEAAKSLQMAINPGSWDRVWNDQPPLLSMIGGFAFKIFGSSMLVGRIVVILLGLSIPLTVAIYCSQLGIRWAAPASAILLWVALPASWAPFMQEAPAYATALAALLPLLLRGHERVPLCVSALIAAAALSIKLTAAFGLVVPFVWLWQRSPRKAFAWGMLTVTLTVVSSLMLPGWSWSTMQAAHLQTGNGDALRFNIQPDAYASGWLICMLALFAVGNRYIANRLTPVVPWLSAAVAALGIHFFHHPYFGYYDLHLIAPLAILGAIGMTDVYCWLRAGQFSFIERWSATAGVVLLCGLWGWQRTNQITSLHQWSNPIAASPIVKHLKSIHESGFTAFAIDPVWTFTAGMPQTPPEFTIMSLKRSWSGQMNDAMVTATLASNHVAGIVITQRLMKQAEWSNLLSGFSASARSDTEVLYVRNDLNPKRIELDDQFQLFRRLGF